MKLRYGTLKHIIREAMKPVDKAQEVLQAALATAEGYVDSLVAGHRDARKASELQLKADSIVSLAKWLLSKHDPRAESIAQAAMYIKQISDASSFWATPSFMNRDDHVEKMKSAIRRAERAAVSALKPN